jgi:drug/metabolite transporter (DMT)-like permease
MTRLAVAALDPTLVTAVRILLAAACAALYLSWTRAPLPCRADLPGLLRVALAVVLGFPLLTASALTRVDSAHGAIVLAILPLLTAIAGLLRARERPSLAFWFWAAAGAAAVLAFQLRGGAGPTVLADLWLVLACLAAAWGYAEGAVLARRLPGLAVIGWALLPAAPLAALVALTRPWSAGTPSAWAAVACLGVLSQFPGFWAWCGGLARGGIALVGQVQLLQTFLTLAAAGLIFAEPVPPLAWVVALLTVVCILGARRAAKRA